MGTDAVDGGVPCTSPTTCAAATDMGTTSGDTGSGSLSAMGATSRWLRVRVTEDDVAIFGREMSLRAILTNPPGTDYDVYLYLNQTTDALECVTSDAMGALEGGNEVARVAWGEGAQSNGAMDDRTVSIEIRHVSGPCGGTPWMLTVTGNQ